MHISFFRSLRFRIPLMVILAVLPTIIVGFTYESYRNSRDIERSVKEKLAAATLAQKQHISLWLRMHQIAVKNLSKQPGILSLNAKENQPILEEILNSYEHIYSANTAGLDGYNIARGDRKPKNKNYFDRTWFKGALAGNEITFQTLVGKNTQNRAVCMSTPMRSKNVIAAVFYICSTLDEITKQIGTVKIGKTGYAILVDEMGQIISHPKILFSQSKELVDFSEYPPVKALLSGKEGYFEFTDERQIDLMSHIQHLDNGWGIIILQEKAEAFLPKKRFQEGLVISACVMVVIVGLTVLFIASQIVKPISLLAQASSDFAEGRPDHSVSFSRHDELGVLAEAFNTMSVQVRESFGKIESQYADQLKASNEELEAFAYSVSHDLRAPLRAIDGFSKALVDDYGNQLEGEAKEYLDAISENANRMGVLIEELLNLSKVSRVEIQYQAVNLSQLAQSILNQLRLHEPNRQVDVTITPDVIVSADPTLMRVVLENLLNNAWKFTSHHLKAHITFGLISSGPEPIYYVKDDGAGFNIEYQNQLFQVFQRLHHTYEFPGTGIGLASVQRAIHRHAGRVWADAAIEKGATFFFTISGSIKNHWE